MKKSIFLFFAAILCAIGMNAAQVTPNGKYFYFKTSSTWNVDGPRYSVYFAWRNGGGEDKTWASCKTVPGTTDILYVTAPGEFWDIYFCRMNGSAADNKDANVWNKTDKLQYDGSKNFWTKSTGWNGTTSYSTYVPAISSVTLSDNGTNIISGTGTQADPYLVYVETTIKVEGTGTKVLDDPDAKLNYNFKQGTTSKQEGISATYQFTASATADTECIINLDGYTKVNTTKSSVTKSATALYYKTVERAEETNSVTISYKCSDKDVQTGITEVVGVSSTSSFTAPTVTGYKFTNWTIGAGIDLKAGTASDATITIVTKSASSDYTLVANYEEVMETVYFINTPKWTSVKAYAYSPENHTWPGVDATKEAEKIGEYEVYSYTATQGKYANVIFNGSGGQTADLDWTADKYYIHNYNGNTGWYTKEEAEELLVVPVVEETIYFVNNKKWTKVQAYAWNSTGNNTWPGVALTATGEKVADYDVYSYTAPQGYVNVIFNNKTGETGVQSADFVWTNGKYYYMDADANYAGGTKEEVAVLVAPDPLATEVYLAGDMTNKDNWDVNKKEFKKTTAEATTASVTVTLAAQTYKFKLVVGGAWKGNTGKMERGGESVHEGGWSFDKDGYDDNCQIVADIAGDYTFTWDLNTKKLTVTYPPLPKYTVTVIAENGSVTGVGEYEQGSEANLVATPNAGYAFQNWTKGGEVVSTEATYTFIVTANVELVANFVPEVTHEVTVSYLCGGNPIVGQTAQTLAVGVTTPSTVSAPAITNYKFDSWTLGTGVQSEDDTKNPIQITTLAEGEYSLVANYTKIELTYTVTVPEGTEKCYIAGEMNSWSFQEMTPTANANEFTITIDGATTAHKYKYTCGEGWAFVEKKEDGSELDADRTYNANDVVAKWAEPAKCYLMGIGGDWTTGIEMEEDGDQFKLLCQPIAEGEQFKFKYGDTWTTDVENYTENGVNWVESDPGSGQYNITLPAGNYDFYYKKNDNKVWIGVCTPATPTPDYTREGLTEGDLGTICLPSNVPSGKASGATFYTLAGRDANGKIVFNEILSGELEAGKPYLFQATATEIVCFYGTESVTKPDNSGAMKGTFEAMMLTGSDLTNIYYFAQNALWSCVDRTESGLSVPANRAYVDMDDMPAISESNLAPGVRRITLGVNGQQVATGMEDIDASAQPVKAIINGQLFILRGEKTYDAQGKLVK